MLKYGLTPRRVVVALFLTTLLGAAACAPDTPAPTTTTTTSTIPGGNQAPHAAASFTANTPNWYSKGVQFSSAGSVDPDGTIASYYWEFNDGSTSVQQPEIITANPKHVFKQPGTYNYTLTVTDNHGATGVASGTITQGEPSGAVTVLPSPVTTPMNTIKSVRVWWSGQAPGKLIFADVCSKSIADPTFVRAFDCAPLSEMVPNGTASGKGFVDIDFFRGADPSGDQQWGCFAPGDTAPAGIQKRTCYVRVTNNIGLNTDDDAEIAVPLTDASA